jgi:predicted small secreted protein
LTTVSRTIAAVASVVLLALLVAGCGEGEEVQARAECDVAIWLADGWTPGQVDSMRKTLRRHTSVERTNLLSSSVALGRAQDEWPDLVEGLPYSPFPDSIEVMLKTGGDPDSVVALLTPPPPGAASVHANCSWPKLVDLLP